MEIARTGNFTLPARTMRRTVIHNSAIMHKSRIVLFYIRKGNRKIEIVVHNSAIMYNSRIVLPNIKAVVQW